VDVILGSLKVKQRVRKFQPLEWQQWSIEFWCLVMAKITLQGWNNSLIPQLRYMFPHHVTFGLTFLKIRNLLHLIHLENNIKTSCYPAKIPVDFRFTSLSLSVILCWCPSFPSYFSPTVAHPTHCTEACFSHYFCCCFFAYFTWRWFDAVCYFFTTCEQARNQLGTPGVEKSFLRGAQIF